MAQRLARRGDLQLLGNLGRGDLGELTVKEWRRYGKARLYVTDRIGGNVGYYDRQTSELHVEDLGMRHRALEALAPFPGGDISALTQVVERIYTVARRGELWLA